uniref:Ribosomal protein S14 n=1 Tax=Vicia sepium TaxID=347188 RepID=A0A2H4N050_9FABA|nr:ribosomal protein S14 [Vicia sepium]
MARKKFFHPEKKRPKLDLVALSTYRCSWQQTCMNHFTKYVSGISPKLQSPPLGLAPTRLHRRCFLTGLFRGNYCNFPLSGHILREKQDACLFFRATRISW